MTPASEYVWGIDPSLSRVAIAFASLSNNTIDVRSLCTRSDTSEGERLGLLDRQVRIFTAQCAGNYPPAVVWIEQPSGRFRNLALTYCVGVIQAAVFETLRCPVWTIPSSAWKVRTVGVGNATKPQVRAWVHQVGVNVATQDEADAVAIASAGRAMTQAGRWQVAA